MSIIRYVTIYTLLMITTGCGVSKEDPFGKRFEKTKDELYDEQTENANLSTDNRILVNLLKSSFYDNEMIWVFNPDLSDMNFNTAQSICKNAQFELPTKEQLEVVKAREEFKQALIGDHPFAFTKNDPNSTGFVVCVRKVNS